MGKAHVVVLTGPIKEMVVNKILIVWGIGQNVLLHVKGHGNKYPLNLVQVQLALRYKNANMMKVNVVILAGPIKEMVVNKILIVWGIGRNAPQHVLKPTLFQLINQGPEQSVKLKQGRYKPVHLAKIIVRIMLIAMDIGQNVLLHVKGHGHKQPLNLVQVQLALLLQEIVLQVMVIV